jgi:serine/threonine protein kinase
VFAGAFDAYVAAPLDKVLLDKSFDVKNVKLGGRLGDGSFGQVFGATDTKTDADLVVKQAKSVQGAAQLQNAEEYMNRRVRRAPLAAIGCAKYLGSYDVVEGAASPSLVWAREGDVTLEDLINSRDYPGCLEEALYGDVSDSDDFAKRTNRAAKTVLRRLLFTLSQLHDIGVVHRDVKPANLVLADTESAFKLVDFGAAADLRTGYNYEPEQGLLDPFYSPPENFIMPERIPAPPPLRPIAASFSPLVWAAFLPDLFDSFSAGLVFLQMCVPQLRGRKVMDPNGAFRRNLEDANYDLRKWRKVVEPQGWDFSALDVGGGLGWDLACRLVCKRNALQRGRLGCNTALLHPFFWTP